MCATVGLPGFNVEYLGQRVAGTGEERAGEGGTESLRVRVGVSFQPLTVETGGRTVDSPSPPPLARLAPSPHSGLSTHVTSSGKSSWQPTEFPS